MIDDPNIEYEDKPEVDEDGNPIWYMTKLPNIEEFTSYNFKEVPENIPDGYYESVWGTAKTKTTTEQEIKDLMEENTAIVRQVAEYQQEDANCRVLVEPKWQWN